MLAFGNPIDKVVFAQAVRVSVGRVEIFEMEAVWHAVFGKKRGNFVLLQAVEACVVLVQGSRRRVWSPVPDFSQELQGAEDEATSRAQVFDVLVFVCVTSAEDDEVIAEVCGPPGQLDALRDVLPCDGQKRVVTVPEDRSARRSPCLWFQGLCDIEPALEFATLADSRAKPCPDLMELRICGKCEAFFS